VKSVFNHWNLITGSDNFAVCTDDDDFRIWVIDIEKKQAYLSDKVRFPETPETEDEEDLMIDALTVTKDGKYIVSAKYPCVISDGLTSYPIKKIWDSKQVKISPSFPSDGAMTHKKIFLNLYYIVRKLKFTHRRQIIQMESYVCLCFQCRLLD
jgi:hypothetical protein